MPAAVRARIERRGAPRLTSQDSRIAAFVRTGVLRIAHSVSMYVEGRNVSLSIPLDFESVRYTALDQSVVEIGGKWGSAKDKVRVTIFSFAFETVQADDHGFDSIGESTGLRCEFD